MTPGKPNLRVQISADIADLKQGLALARGEIVRLKQEGNRAMPETSGFVGGLGKIKVASAAAGLALAGMATAAVAGVRAAIDRADDMSKNAQRVGMTTEALSELAYAAKLADVDMSQLKTGLRFLSDEVGKGGKNLKQFGVDVRDSNGQLRPTKDILYDVADRFAKMPDGIGKVNAAMKIFGSRAGPELIPALNGGSDAMRAAAVEARVLGQVIDSETGAAAEQFNDNLSRLKDVGTGLANGLMTELLPMLVGVSDQMVEGAKEGNGMAAAGKFLADVFRVVGAVAIYFKNQVESVVVVLAALAHSAIEVASTLASQLGTTFTSVGKVWDAVKSGDVRGAMEVWKSAFSQMDDRAAQSGRNIANNFRTAADMVRQNVRETVGGVNAMFADVELPARKAADAVGGENGLAGGLDKSTKAAGKAREALRGLVDEAELAADNIKRALAALDLQRSTDASLGIREYYAQRQALELEAINIAIGQAEAEARAARSNDQQRKALTQIVKLQSDRADVIARIARDEAEDARNVETKLDQLRARLLAAQGDSLGAKTIELRQEFDQLLRDLPASAQSAGQALIDKLMPIELARARREALADEVGGVMADLQSKEMSVSAQMQAGMLGMLEGERQLKEARQQALKQLVESRQKAVEFLATLSPDSPEAAQTLKFIEQLDGNIATVASTMDRLKQQVADAAIESVTQLFMDLVDGSKSAGEALRDFVRGFVRSMAQIAARALATYLVLQLLDAIYPGLGKATAAGMSAGVNHHGGIAGQSHVRRSVNPAWFGAAPRYHGGGIAGLAPDEVPAILQRGEEVLTRNDPRHRDNGGRDGGGRTIVKTPVVAIGDRAVADALAGAAGEDVVLTHVRNNWGALSSGA